MTLARSSLISLPDTPWYHLYNRCVRRAFLCGHDNQTGRDFSHRKQWIEARIRQLAGVFALDVAAYAVMSNHYHVVVRVDQETAEGWSIREVLERWTQLFKGSPLVQGYLAGNAPNEAEILAIDVLAAQYRKRLFDVSWFMRILNESIARMANAEDGVGGRFWEGRFKSQALLDEQAVLTAMSYVDLNPLRAGLSQTPEDSEHTSIQARIQHRDAEQAPPDSLLNRHTPELSGAVNEEPMQAIPLIDSLPQAALLPFDGSGQHARAIDFSYLDYLEWVDYIGRAVHPDKRGSIPEGLPKLAKRLNIDPKQFIKQSHGLLERFGHAVGCAPRLKSHGAGRSLHHLRGMAASRRLFSTA